MPSTTDYETYRDESITALRALQDGAKSYTLPNGVMVTRRDLRELRDIVEFWDQQARRAGGNRTFRPVLRTEG
jgi:hypothetical protein